MASVAVFNFVPPRVVTPGEYFVRTNEHYASTTRNTHWNPFQEYSSRYVCAHLFYAAEFIEGSIYNRRPSIILASPSIPGPSTPNRPAMSDKTPISNVRRSGASKVTIPASSKIRKPSPKSAGKAKHKPSAKKTVSRPVGLWVKATPHKKRTPRATPPPTGPRKCRWNLCNQRIEDGRDIWAHILAVHDHGRDFALVGKDVGEAEHKPKVEDSEMADEGQGPEAEEDGPPGGKTADDRGKRLRESERVRCAWHGCSSEIQYVGLRRHIESKHIPIRGAECPKGCGYWMSRGDMLWRHVERCEGPAPKDDDGEEEEEEWDE